METIKKKEWTGMRASASAINAYKRCPRYFYFNYIEKIETPKNMFLVKGTIIHSVMEVFFNKYEKKLTNRMMTLLNTYWDFDKSKIDKLNLSTEEVAQHKKDCVTILKNYLNKFKENMKMLKIMGKVENQRHAFFLLKPKFVEKWLEDKDLKVCGKLDYGGTDFEGQYTIGDYKTSMKYGMSFKKDYYRALIIYAYLVVTLEGIIPHWLAINYLRFGDVDRFAFTPDMVNEARELILEFHEKTKSDKIKDYPKTNNPKICAAGKYTCEFFNICNGTDEFDTKTRIKKLKEQFKKRGKNESNTTT